MLEIERLEEELKIQYPSSLSEETQKKRLHNIKTLQDFIKKSIDDHGLSFGEKEMRLYFYTTKKDEKVGIQFPGKESEQTVKRIANNKVREFDFRPKIELPSGSTVRDLTFADQWSIVEELNSGHMNIMKALTTIFFHIGRMTYHKLKDLKVEYIIVDENGNSISEESGSVQMQLYVPEFSDEIIETVNYNCSGIKIDGEGISFEAFIMNFNYLIENEDSKYYDIKRNLTSGRITTSDSMLLLASYFSGGIKLSKLLQAYVSGFGAAKCQVSDIPTATGGLVEIVDRDADLQNILTDKGVDFKKSSHITVNKKTISVYIKVPAKKVALLRSGTEEQIEQLESRGWHVFLLSEIANNDRYSELLDLIG